MKLNIPDGSYPCSAVIVIKDGKAEILLNSNLVQKNGSDIPLACQPDGSKIMSKNNGFSETNFA